LIKIIIFSVASFFYCYGFTNYLISDFEFTNHRMFSKKKYITAFAEYIGTNRVKQIVYAGKYYKINPLILFTKLQCESGQLSTEPTRDINDFAFCCAIHIKNKGTNWNTFNWQAWKSSYWLRKHYDYAASNNYSAFIYDTGKYEKLKNAATYSLYRYTPHYILSGSKFNKKYTLGNHVFLNVYRSLKNKIKDNLIITNN
jgi:hypothetical protein